MAVASAGPYANNLHLTLRDISPHQHLMTEFFTGQMLLLMIVVIVVDFFSMGIGVG